ncbi:hypothetical protein BKA56DRAFT_637484 [Ilyonectria sp. MPI-CAGE-AT-0026]|nr:hypothetical protein BKA56DRAFT_637484 [Ilyonectria sp. MPI-CAGE-AT-0026]
MEGWDGFIEKLSDAGDKEGEEYPNAAEGSLFLPIEASNAALLLLSLCLSYSEEGYGEEFESSVAVETSCDYYYEGEEGEREDKGDEDEDEKQRQEEKFKRWISRAENADISLLSDEREEEDKLSHQYSERDGDIEDKQGDISSPSTPLLLALLSGYYREHNTLYSAGLRRLYKALEAKYNLNNISYIFYTLAVDIHCTAARMHPGEGAGPARSIRYRPNDLLASYGLTMAQLWGQLTPNNPSAIEAAVQAKEYIFRFEQCRNFHTLIRLFLKEKQLYAGVLRRFPPEIFPGILIAFAKVLEAAMAEMDCYFREGGSKGLGIALLEGVAALDRLGNFCFTGDSRPTATVNSGLPSLEANR